MPIRWRRRWGARPLRVQVIGTHVLLDSWVSAGMVRESRRDCGQGANRIFRSGAWWGCSRRAVVAALVPVGPTTLVPAGLPRPVAGRPPPPGRRQAAPARSPARTVWLPLDHLKRTLRRSNRKSAVQPQERGPSTRPAADRVHTHHRQHAPRRMGHHPHARRRPLGPQRLGRTNQLEHHDTPV